MTTYWYVAVDERGKESRGSLDVASQFEAIGRIKQMGLYPVKILENRQMRRSAADAHAPAMRGQAAKRRTVWFVGGVPPAVLAVFTRQLATLIEAGLPLLRGLRILHDQEENRRLRIIIDELANSIESGCSFAEAVGSYPKIFSSLYVNMVKAGEVGGALDVTLKRLAEFMEKAQRIKGKIKSSMFYPCAVMFVALAILILLMGFVVPRFKSVFEGLFNGAPLPAFTLFILRISEAVQHRIGLILVSLGVLVVTVLLMKRTTAGRWALDRLKLAFPLLGPVYRKAVISRFTRTLGTLLGNGVPILQALTIVRETAGNRVFARMIHTLHENVKSGDPLAPSLKASGLFPSMVAGMVDVGEQTGSLPDMLLRVANTYDEQVDNATNGLTSLLEPLLIVFLAIVVGSIVIAMFLPIIKAPGMIDFNPNSAVDD